VSSTHGFHQSEDFRRSFLLHFTAMTGVGIVVPFLPVYAYDLGLGASGIYISLIFGAFSLSRSVFLPYFGRCSDRRGRKPFIVSGLFVFCPEDIRPGRYHICPRKCR